jgi:hypothetical protein
MGVNMESASRICSARLISVCDQLAHDFVHGRWRNS